MDNIKNIILLLLVIFSVGQIYCNTIIGPGMISYEKFQIYYNGGKLHCGSLTCPRAVKCIITQKNAQNDVTKLITKEKCFNEDDELVNHSEVTENARRDQNNVNLRIEHGPNGHFVLRTKSEEEIRKDLQENAEKLRRRLEDINLRNEERQRRLEQSAVERRERLAADAERRAANQVERVKNNLARQGIERGEIVNNANRRLDEELNKN